MIQVISAQISFASQPQAYSAQIGPATSTPKVQIGKANACTLYASASIDAASGSRLSAPDSPARSFSRYSADISAPTVKAPPAIAAADTWMTIQYECSAGTSGPAGEYSFSTARPSVAATTATTPTPSHCSLSRRTPNR